MSHGLGNAYQALVIARSMEASRLFSVLIDSTTCRLSLLTFGIWENGVAFGPVRENFPGHSQ